MSGKRGGKQAKKQVEVKSSNAKAEKNKAQLQERRNAMTIFQAKTKLTNELEKLKKTGVEVDIQKTVKEVTGKNAERILDADDVHFENMVGITNLLQNVVIVDNGAQNETSKLRKEDFPITTMEVMAFACAIARTPMHVDEDDEPPAKQKELSDLQIGLCATVLARLNMGRSKYPAGKTSKLMLDTENIIMNLMRSLVAVRRYRANVPLKSEGIQEKDIPPTPPLYYDDNYREHTHHVNVLEKNQNYRFEFPEQDALLSKYVQRTRQVIKRPCLMIQWAIDNEPHMRVQFSVRQKLQKMLQKGRDAYDKLNSLSQVISFLHPAFDKKCNIKYNEMAMMLHVTRDLFTRELKPTDTQMAQIAKMKNVEMKRRIAEKQDDLDAMIKNFEYLDIQISKTRTKNRTARFYFYLAGYIETQCNIITRAYWHALDVMTVQLETLYNGHAERFGLDKLEVRNVIIAAHNFKI